MYPGRIVKCKVDSIMWATAQGQLPIGSMNPAGGVAPVPANSLAVRLLPDGKDKGICSWRPVPTVRARCTPTAAR